MKKLCTLIMGVGLLLSGFAQAADAPAEAPVLRIGARVFTEQTMLAELTAQYLRDKGYQVQITGGLGSNLARSAQESGQLDLLWEYTGVSLVAYNHVDEKLDSEQTYQRVKELDAKKGLVWLSPSKFNNTYALALPDKIAQQYPQVNTMSDLTAVLKAEADKGHIVALDTEFANRSDGLVGMVKHYGMNLGRENTRQMDAGLHRTAQRAGFCGPRLHHRWPSERLQAQGAGGRQALLPGLHRCARDSQGIPGQASATGRPAQATRRAAG
jgi:osmoprotectant transport system substrate-binding protein